MKRTDLSLSLHLITGIFLSLLFLAADAQRPYRVLTVPGKDAYAHISTPERAYYPAGDM